MPSTVHLTFTFDKFSRTFLDAVADLIETIQDADPALLEDTISESHERLIATLRDDE